MGPSPLDTQGDGVAEEAVESPVPDPAVEPLAQAGEASVTQTARRDISQVFAPEDLPRDFYPDDVEHA